jgi:hypothetical protein
LGAAGKALAGKQQEAQGPETTEARGATETPEAPDCFNFGFTTGKNLAKKWENKDNNSNTEKRGAAEKPTNLAAAENKNGTTSLASCSQGRYSRAPTRRRVSANFTAGFS